MVRLGLLDPLDCCNNVARAKDVCVRQMKVAAMP